MDEKRRGRIDLDDSMMMAMMKIVEGNPGAINVCAQLVKVTSEIDPDSGLGPWTYILSLDDHEIFGSRIWMLYKDVCGEDIRNTIAVLRANQLGFVSREDVNTAIDNYGKGIDVPALLKKVQERLPGFKKLQSEIDLARIERKKPVQNDGMSQHITKECAEDLPDIPPGDDITDVLLEGPEK